MTVTLIIKQSTEADGTENIVITQPGTAGIKGTEEKRHIPTGTEKEWRDHEDHVFGHVKGKHCLNNELWNRILIKSVGYTQWRKLSELSDTDEDEKFLKEGWLDEADYIDSYVESQGNGWTAHQVWGFAETNGVRKYTRRVVVKKGKDVKRARFV